jgi:hypothetical protein
MINILKIIGVSIVIIMIIIMYAGVFIVSLDNERREKDLGKEKYPHDTHL